MFGSCSRSSDNAVDFIKTVIESTMDSSDIHTCDEYEEKIMAAADTGNFLAVREYLENGGNPNLKCDFQKSFINSTGKYLYIYIMLSDSVELIKYYLTLDISDDIKSEFLRYNLLPDGNDEIVQILININAHYVETDCFRENIDVYRKLAEFNYDFNWKNPDYSGETMLMDLASCSCLDSSLTSAHEIIEIMKLLIDKGARTDIKKDNGESLLEVATNDSIIEFIKNLK